jgi:hypothetical protein
VHRPVFYKEEVKKEEVSTEVVKGVGNDSLLDGELCIKMAGVEYPLHQRAIKELQMPRIKLFTSYTYLLLSNRENQNLPQDN